MKKMTQIAAAIALAATAGTAVAGPISDSASSFSYDSVGVTYTQQDVDFSGASGRSDDDRDIIGLEGTLSLTPNVYAGANIGYTDDMGSRDTQFGMKLGYHRDLGLSTPVDFYSEAGLTTDHYTPDADASDDREFSWAGELGLRSNLNVPGLDATLSVGASELEHADGEYEFTPVYGVGASYYVADDISVGVRYQYVDLSDSDTKETGMTDLSNTTVSLKYHF